jgi:HlyD family secretion protein
MSATLAIATGQETEAVVAVPAQAVMPPNAAGQRLVVVQTPAGLEQREVEAGRSNGKLTEVRAGLKEGEEVILNPRALYGEMRKKRPSGDQ